MKKLALLGRSNLPQSSFEISRDIRLTDQEYSPNTVAAYATPNSLPKEASRALREYWAEMQRRDSKLFEATHPQVNASRVTIVGKHEMLASRKPKTYRGIARELLKSGEHTKAELVPSIGTTAFNCIALRELPKGKGRLLILQPSEGSPDSGVEFLREQRKESLEALGELAIRSDEPQTRHRYFGELPADVGVPLAIFSPSVQPTYCTEIAAYIQQKVGDAVQTMTTAAPSPKLPKERLALEAFALGPTQTTSY